MAKRVTSRPIKAYRQYTYEQAADALGISVQTVRGWRKSGLPVLTEKIPHLIIGAELKAFLDGRNAKPKIKLTLEQFRCMRCAGLVEAYGGMVDYTALTLGRGILSTLCGNCEGVCTKFASLEQVTRLSQILSVTIRNDPKQAGKG